MSEIPQRVLLRFPEHCSHVARLMSESADFREVCEDYAATAAWLEEGGKPPRELADAEALLNSLEIEIQSALGDTSGS